MQSFTTYLQVGGVAKTSSIKSIQRGTGKLDYTKAPNSSYETPIKTTFPINTVNPDKTIVLLDGTIGQTGSYNVSGYLDSLTEDSFTICPSYDTTVSRRNTFSWQVIEFY